MVFAGVSGQQAEISVLNPDDAYLAGLPRLTMPPGYASRPLPAKKDNSRLIYCPGIYNQEVWNCNQAASVWTMFTYEINYLRNLSSSLTDNQYSPMAVFNLLNHGHHADGVSYFDSWELIKANGIPANPDFTAYSQNSTVWMTGYDKYYRGMKNRVEQVYAIDVGTPEGLLTLKHWINDHLEDKETGGLANFQIGSGTGSEPMVIKTIPDGQEGEGEPIVIKYHRVVGHAMTFAGWNDEIKYDWNGDGRYTNNEDITGDGVVDMRDWEIGAMRVINSWGTGWGDNGKAWVMNRLLAEDTLNGGIWNNAVIVVKPKKTHEPLLTIKARIRYNHRSRLRLRAGIASSPDATVPDRIIDFPCFSFQGDTLPMQGYYGLNADLIEIGLDISRLLEYFPVSGQAKIFFDVVQKSPNNRGAGRIESFSVMDYSNGIHEYACTQGVQPIQSNTVNRLSVMAGSRVNRPVILTESLPDAQVGAEYRTQIEMEGQVTPLRFANPAALYTASSLDEFIPMTGGTVALQKPFETSKVIDLPYAMPLYGQTYGQVIVLDDGGLIMGNRQVIYPYAIDNRLPFYHNCGIYPFFGTLYYPRSSMQVTVEPEPDKFIVRWNASLDAAGNYPVTFAAAVFPDGRIRFYYGEMNLNPDVTWIVGLSAGNMTEFTLMDYIYTGLAANSAWQLLKYNWPAWLSLGSGGDLRGTPPSEGRWQVPLRLTDGYGISTSATLTLQTSGFSGVSTHESHASATIYPNPVTQSAWLDIRQAPAGTLSLEVFGINGQLKLRRNYFINGGDMLIRCDEIAGLSQGIFFYRMTGVIGSRGKIVIGSAK